MVKLFCLVLDLIAFTLFFGKPSTLSPPSKLSAGGGAGLGSCQVVEVGNLRSLQPPKLATAEVVMGLWPNEVRQFQSCDGSVATEVGNLRSCSVSS